MILHLRTIHKAVFLFPLACLISWNVIACSCIGTQTITKEFRTSDVVIYGEVVSINKHNYSEEERNGVSIGWWVNEVTFKVITPLKNVGTESVTIYTGMGNGDCGFSFIEGETYLVYANDEVQMGETLLRTNSCTRTTRTTADSIELTILKQLAKLD